MLAPLVLLFIAVPILELIVILQVGDLIGLWPTVALLVVDSVVGSLLMRTQGRQAWRRLRAAAESGRPPAREALDGALVVFGGALLLTPGFFTDLVGLALLIPPSRAVVRRVLVRRFAGRMVAGAAARFGAGAPPFPAPARGRAFDAEATATDVPRERLP